MSSIWRRILNHFELGDRHALPTAQMQDKFESVERHVSPTAQKLAKLRSLDRETSVFGANKHRYETRKVEEATLVKLESYCGTRLPESFRKHLAEIGSGAGPYYGLLNLADVQMWHEDWHEVFRERLLKPKGQVISPASPFPFSQSDARAIRELDLAGSKEAFLKADWPVSGCIPICHQGCDYWTVLVISGECVGHVWSAHEEGVWWPSPRPPGRRLYHKKRPIVSAELPLLPSLPSFDDWYVGWLDQSIADFSLK